jgi:hypothetical protein
MVPDTINELIRDRRGLAVAIQSADQFFETACSGDLEQFLERVKILSRESFLAYGDCPSTFFLLSRQDGEFKVAVSIGCTWSNRAEKAQAIGAIKYIIKDEPAGPVLSYCFTSESWASENPNVRPSQSPDRIEMLNVVAEERSGRLIRTSAEIKRHALSPKPGLGEWENTENAETSWNMFGEPVSVARH